MKEKYLPIGTIVILKDGNKEVMITGYAIISRGKVIGTNEDGSEKRELKLNDYSAVTYPEGLLSSNHTVAFDHDNIETIIYNGYESDKQKELSDKLKIEVEKFKKEIEGEQ